MKKVALGILAALLLLSGCSSNADEQNVTNNTNQSDVAKNTYEENNDTNKDDQPTNNDKNNLIMTAKSLQELEELFIIEDNDKFEDSLEKDGYVYSAYEDDGNNKNIVKFDS